MYAVGFLFIVAFIVWALIHDRALLAVVGVVALIVLGYKAQPCFHCGDRERSARSTMRSDLTNLVSTQEAYYADSGTYATDIGALVAAVEGKWNFFLSTDVTVEILVGTDSGHAARAHHEAVPDWTCAVWVGEDGYTALETLPPKLRDKLRQQDDRGYLPEGEVHCEKQ